MRCTMAFTIARLMALRSGILCCLFVSVLMLSLSSQAAGDSWLSVKLEGAKALLYLDLSDGALYVGNDCMPILHFSEAMTLQTRGQAAQRIFKVRKQSLSTRSAVASSRLPESIILQGGRVFIQAGPLMGNSRTLGTLVTDRRLVNRRSAKSCSQ